MTDVCPSADDLIVEVMESVKAGIKFVSSAVQCSVCRKDHEADQIRKLRIRGTAIRDYVCVGCVGDDPQQALTRILLAGKPGRRNL